MVVYGKKREDTLGNVEIEYNILALTNLSAISSEIPFNVRQTNERNSLLFAESATYYKYLDRPVTVIEPLNENATSTLFFIGAFEKYVKSNFTSAINLFRSIKNYENSSSILFYIANSYYFNNDWNISLQYFDKAIGINPQSAEAWNNKGNSLDNLGRYEEALAAYDKVIGINPQDSEAWYNKGVTLANIGRYEEALALFDKAIKINPQNANFWHNKGVILGNMDRYEDALAAYDKVIKIDPQYAEAWYNKGVTLVKLGRYEEAKIAFKNAHKLNPKFEIPS